MDYHYIFCRSYRFNKPRRELDLIQTNNRENDCERDLARRNALNEQYRIQQQYQKLIHRQAVSFIYCIIDN